jgi:polyhydroxyalkanoate synthase
MPPQPPAISWRINADALQTAIDSKGESIAKGVRNLLQDYNQGHMSMTDESLFTVGKNIATTEGMVVFENDYIQLIEYKPLTEKVYEKPFLLVPPSINKYYILDLQPDNSVIRYAVAQGHRTFVVSWRNPDDSMKQVTWDNFIEHAILKAISVTKEITGAPSINTLGFCVGGTMLSTALAVLAARGDTSVSSATFLTAMVDFADTGVLDVFIDEAFVAKREKEMGKGGMMKGSDMASTFSFLRPNDLVWNYVVGNYLKGETPRHSICCTGTPTAPTCLAPSTPGTCATPTLKTTSASRAKPRCWAKRLTLARLISRSISMARVKTTSCQSMALMPPHGSSRGPNALSWVPPATLPV